MSKLVIPVGPFGSLCHLIQASKQKMLLSRSDVLRNPQAAPAVLEEYHGLVLRAQNHANDAALVKANALDNLTALRSLLELDWVVKNSSVLRTIFDCCRCTYACLDEFQGQQTLPVVADLTRRVFEICTRHTFDVAHSEEMENTMKIGVMLLQRTMRAYTPSVFEVSSQSTTLLQEILRGLRRFADPSVGLDDARLRLRRTLLVAVDRIGCSATVKALPMHDLAKLDSLLSPHVVLLDRLRALLLSHALPMLDDTDNSIIEGYLRATAALAKIKYTPLNLVAEEPARVLVTSPVSDGVRGNYSMSSLLDSQSSANISALMSPHRQSQGPRTDPATLTYTREELHAFRDLKQVQIDAEGQQLVKALLEEESRRRTLLSSLDANSARIAELEGKLAPEERKMVKREKEISRDLRQIRERKSEDIDFFQGVIARQEEELQRSSRRLSTSQPHGAPQRESVGDIQDTSKSGV